MHSTVLQRIAAEKNMARFYVVEVEPTLLEDWAVVRSWGRIGARGRSKESWFDDRLSAAASAERLEAAKRHRGYHEPQC